MILLDFETNSHHVRDVIEAAALRVAKVGTQYVVTDTFHRYYFSRHPVNPHALAVHRLSPARLLMLRKNAEYAEHFEEDGEFAAFCEGATTLVAHNIAFELRHLGGLVTFEKHLCTMKANKTAVNARNARGGVKNPKLVETCEFYGIDFDEAHYHSAIYDVTKTLEILNCMGEPERWS
jgi:DNA polymerase-3 subunit epsilon